MNKRLPTRVFLAAIPILLCAIDCAAAPRKDPVVCVAQKNGAITVKSKCSSRETRLAESSYSQGRTTILNVAPKGAKYTSLSAALNAALTLNPSATNPILIKIAPGKYTEGEFSSVPSFVTVEGAGTGATVIRLTTLAISLLSSSNLKHLSIEHAQSTSSAPAISILEGAEDVRVEDVEVTLLNAATFPIGIFSAGTNATLQDVRISGAPSAEIQSDIRVEGGDITIENAELNSGQATGIAIVGAATARIRNSTIKLTKNAETDPLTGINVVGAGSIADIDGVSVTINGGSIGGNSALYISNQGQAIVRNSTFNLSGFSSGVAQADESATGTVLNSDIVTSSTNPTVGAFSSGSMSVGSSRLSGGAANANTGGTLRCAAVYDENFNLSANTCP